MTKKGVLDHVGVVGMDDIGVGGAAPRVSRVETTDGIVVRQPILAISFRHSRGPASSCALKTVPCRPRPVAPAAHTNPARCPRHAHKNLADLVASQSRRINSDARAFSLIRPRRQPVQFCRLKEMELPQGDQKAWSWCSTWCPFAVRRWGRRGRRMIVPHAGRIDSAIAASRPPSTMVGSQ